MPVIVRHSNMSGAPLLGHNTSGGTGDMRELLRQCLITGFSGNPGVGWSMPFTRDGGPAGDCWPGVIRPGVGTRQFYRISETFTHPFSNYSMWAYENIASIDDPAPIDNWFPGQACGRLPDSTAAHKWILIADEKTCHMFWEPIPGSGNYYFFSMGNFHPWKTTDAWCGYAWSSSTAGLTTTPTAAGLGVMRSYDGSIKGQTGSPPLQMGLAVNRAIQFSVPESSGLLPYPNPADGKSWITPIRAVQNNQVISRGRLRGIWSWLHPLSPVADRDTMSGASAGPLAGKTFVAIRNVQNATTGVLLVETSNTWQS